MGFHFPKDLIPQAREIYGSAAIYVATPEPAAVELALQQALYDDAERARVLAAAPAVLQRYSWAETARRTLHVLTRSGGE